MTPVAHAIHIIIVLPAPCALLTPLLFNPPLIFLSSYLL